MFRRCAIVLGVLSLLLSVAVAQADVFNMGGRYDAVTGWVGNASLITVPVGDAGNVADTTGYGAVAYNYNIGKYDVTNAQYCEFLNAKASASDPYGLWNSYMGGTVSGSTYGEGGISRSASVPYTYTVNPRMGNQPVVFVTWYNTLRFANWLTNGQGGGNTESGTYTITGGTTITGLGTYWTVAVPTASQRAAWAVAGQTHWLLPSENEWYKAAYYDPTLNGGSGGYWFFPTKSSNTAPTWELSTATGPNPGSNSGNYYDVTYGYALTGSKNLDSSQDHLTEVGAYPNSLSAYQTLDQGGDVYQWNEKHFSSGSEWFAYWRGGSWNNHFGEWAKSIYCNYDAATESRIAGFRVASVGVPEPGSLVLLLAGAIGLLAYAWRRRK